MGSSVRCPHCEESFFRSDPSKDVDCPACAERVPAAPAGASGAGPAKFKGIGVERTCPSCGASFDSGKSTCPDCGANYRMAKQAKAEEEGGSFAPEKAGVRKGVLGGVVMIVIAAIWFFVGLAAGRIFFYPPILAVIGVFAVIKGLATGNLAGDPSSPVRPRRRG